MDAFVKDPGPTHLFFLLPVEQVRPQVRKTPTRLELR